MEIMITTAILAVMSMIAVPAFMSWLPQMRLNAAARQIKTDLMAARMEAVKRNHQCKIFFLDNYRYQILNDANNDGLVDNNEESVIKDLRDNFPGVSLPTVSADPVFMPRGTVKPGTNTTITIQNPEGSKTVTVAITGRVRIN